VSPHVTRCDKRLTHRFAPLGFVCLLDCSRGFVHQPSSVLGLDNTLHTARLIDKPKERQIMTLRTQTKQQSHLEGGFVVQRHQLVEKDRR
jgi:hypothetical protein